MIVANEISYQDAVNTLEGLTEVKFTIDLGSMTLVAGTHETTGEVLVGVNSVGASFRASVSHA